MAIAKQFGEMYFDGPREYGYGGIVTMGAGGRSPETSLRVSVKPGMRVLDVGCAKGFLVKDLMQETPGPRGIRPRRSVLCADAL